MTDTADPARTAEQKRRIAALIDELAPVLIDLSRHVHATPEVAFQEVACSAAIVEVLMKYDIPVVHPAFGLGTAFVAEFGPVVRPRVAVVSEYDALPDIGHGCGHNIIAAIGLGATLALHSLGDQMAGSVRYIGTPAEERGCGKGLLARSGAWDDVDAAMMLHPLNVNLKAIRTRCIAEAHITFVGKAAHAAVAPEAARSALDALVLAYQALAQLRQHLCPTERVSGVLTAGGSVPNVVPETASARYFLRAATAAELAQLKDRAIACLHGAAIATGCELQLSWTDPKITPACAGSGHGWFPDGDA